MSIPILPDFLTNKNDIAEILTISFNLIFVVVLTNVGHCSNIFFEHLVGCKNWYHLDIGGSVCQGFGDV